MSPSEGGRMEISMIPHKIHYCWFGEKEKPVEVLNYIETWKKIFPDYEIVEWNEKNFDINSCKYVSEAYTAQKYAFVTDYVRLVALFEVGGLYFDTDIEAKRKFDSLVDNYSMILGFEDDHYVMTGFMAAEPKLKCFSDLIEIYKNKKFLLENGKYDLLPNPVIVTKVMEKYGLATNGKQQEFGNHYVIYPAGKFSAFNIACQKLEVTEDTCLVHHCMGSWQTPKDKLKPWIKSKVIKILGKGNFEKLKSRFYKKR